jgi:hypothetical protein
MKRTLFLILQTISIIGLSQCIPDPSFSSNSYGLYPDTLINLPICYNDNVNGYETSLTLNTSTDTLINVTGFGDVICYFSAFRINNVIGLPAGFSYAPNQTPWNNGGTSPNFTPVQGCISILASQAAIQSVLNSNPSGTEFPITFVVDAKVSSTNNTLANFVIANKWLSEVTTVPGVQPINITGYKLIISNNTSLGTITGNGFSSSNNPAALSFSAISSGCPSFTYQWYSKSGVVSAPTGSSTTGWTLIPGATSNTYDPPTLYNSTSYACFVTPLSSCGNAAWAGGLASFTITTSSGSVNTQQVSQCTSSSVPLTFDSQPVGLGNTSYQWYYANGSVSCPQGNTTSGWTSIAGATSSTSSFVPPSSGTYTLACLVTPEGIIGIPAQWASGCKTVVVNNFTAQPIIGIQSITPFNPYTYLVSQVSGHTYSWTAYGGAVSSGQGSNQISVVWAATGPYQLMLIENNGVCSDTSYLDVENSTITQISETEFSLSNVLVFPNPTDVGFTIQSNAIIGGESIELLDQVGRVVIQTNAAVNSTYMSTANLAKGIYFLRLPKHPGYSRKLIVN